MRAFIYRKLLLLLSVGLASSVFAQTPNIIINEFLTSNAHINYDPDYRNYSDWIELYNNESYSINLNGYYLTDDLSDPTKWRVVNDLIIESNGYFVFWANGIDKIKHTNFKLNKDGEQIGLFSPGGSIVDTVTYKSQQTDISIGRNPNNDNEWLYYFNPTPGSINNTKGYTDLTKCLPPLFSEDSGFYTGDISLEITAEPEAEIRYTLDGSEPDENSEKYTVPINISDRIGEPNYFSEIPTNINPYSWIQPWYPPIGEVRKATIARARTFSPGKIPSSIVTHSYFIGSDIKNAFSTIPVISIVSDEKHLFSDSAGIYVPGISYTGERGTGNYMYDWNRPAHIQYFDKNGNLKISQEVDVRTQGSSSQTSPQKGLHIIARGKYGKSTIDYPLFENSESKANKLTSFKRFMIRAWGSNWQYAMFSDAFAQTIYAKSSLDIQDYHPTIIFLNGEYWGLQEIREANKNPYYFQEHYGIDKDDPGIDLLQLEGEFIDEGDDIHWQQMVEFINNNDLSITQNYKYIKTQMDVDNFIDYIGHTVYCGKFDWPGQNEAFWRPRTADGRWKWIQYDMDTSFGLHGGIGSDYDMINHVVHGGFNNRGAHPILVHLLNNQQFKIKFINWFMDRLNSEFLPEILEKKLTDMVLELDPYMEEHRERWALRNNWWLQWDYNVNIIYDYINTKPRNLILHLQNEFGLDSTAVVVVNIDGSGGTVKINSLLINENTVRTSENPYPWSGKYFKDVPIILIAIPNKGFVFDHWEGSFESRSDSISYTLTGDASLIAVFSPIEKIDSLYINEILVNNKSINTDSTGEYNGWIELYNASNDTINLEGLYLTDDFSKRTKWIIPKLDSISFNILPDEFKLIWCDGEQQEGQNHVGFSLKDMGGQLGLVQIAGTDTVYIDSVSYSQQSPNISYGRFPNASNNWQLFLTPSPGSKNIHVPLTGEVNNSPELLQNYPNPFKNFTIIPTYLPDITTYQLSIYDITGKSIKEFLLKRPTPGYHTILWNGLDTIGKTVPSGVYLYSLYSGKLIQTKKMLYIK